MRNKLTFLLLSLLSVSLFFSLNAFSQDTVVRVVPAPITSVEVGQEFTVDVVIENGQNVAGYQVVLLFDPEIFKYVGFQPGDYLPEAVSFEEPRFVGKVFVYQQLLFAATAAHNESNGDGVLITFTFQVLNIKASAFFLNGGNIGTVLSNQEGKLSLPELVGANVFLRTDSDLVVESVGAKSIRSVDHGSAVSKVSSGQEFDLYATVKNQGTEKSTETQLKYYRSVDKIISPEDDVLLGTFIIQAQPVNGTVEMAIRVTAPKTPGIYYYGACLTGSPDEGNKQNNCSRAIEITVVAMKPDLVVKSIAVYSTATRWNNVSPLITFSVTVTNSGDIESKGTEIRFYSSSNENVSKYDREIKMIEENGSIIEVLEVPPLSPDEDFELTVSTRAPTPYRGIVDFTEELSFNTAMSTIHYYRAYVDSVENEIDTDNNWSRLVSTTIRDLFSGISELDYPENLIQGVAFGPNYTCFIVRAQFPMPQDVPINEITLQSCVIKLDIPGVPTNPATDENDARARNPKYFMFPLATPTQQIVEVKEQAREKVQNNIKKGVAAVAGAVAGAAIVTAIPAVAVTAAVGAKAGSKVGTFAFIGVDAVKGMAEKRREIQGILASTADPILIFAPFKAPENLTWHPENWDDVLLAALPNFIYSPDSFSDSSIDILFFVKNMEVRESLPIRINQHYLHNNDHKVAKYWGEWRLEEIWAEENSGSAAPHARPMSLADYPPFRRLSPEVQEYLLQHFGEFANPEATNAEVSQVPEETSLLSNYPNPFNPETWIPYQLSKPADVIVTIYDTQGRVVRALDLGHQRAGMYHGQSRAAYWDGRNAQGEPVASGVYFYTLKAGDFTATRKMLIRK